MMIVRVLAVAVGIAGVTGVTVSGFKACDPCAEKCNIPCNTPNPALPVVWDDTPDEVDSSAVNFQLNPYNSLRPEYRDAPPSKADLEKIWQHHAKDHSYKSPFVRPMKSGLWEAGVPNRYASSGYNRRKFNKEADALDYVRHKTGAGSSIAFDHLPADGLSNQNLAEPTSPGGASGPSDADSAIAELSSGADMVLLETKAKDEVEKVASASTLPTTDLERTAESNTARVSRDHGLKVAHKMRDFLANYRPDHEVHVVSTAHSDHTF